MGNSYKDRKDRDKRSSSEVLTRETVCVTRFRQCSHTVLSGIIYPIATLQFQPEKLMRRQEQARLRGGAELRGPPSVGGSVGASGHQRGCLRPLPTAGSVCRP